jgi:tetratricopeptide (TPR) repeat protein
VAGKEFKKDYVVEKTTSVVTSLVPRFWAGEYIRQLLGSGLSADDNRSKVLELGLEYGLMTPYTSILALESEAAYARQNVKRHTSPLRGVKLTSLDGEPLDGRLASWLGENALPISMAGCEAKAVHESQEGAETAFAGKPSAAAAPAPSPAYGKEGTPAAKQDDMAGSLSASAMFGDSNEQTPADNRVARMAAAPAASAPGALDSVGEGGGGRGEGIGLGSIGTIGHGAGAPAHRPPAASAGLQTKVAGAQPAAKPVAIAPRRGVDGPTGHASATGNAPTDSVRDAKDAIDKAAKEKAQAAAQKPPTSVARRSPTRCSDAASRPLPERIMLWTRRLTGVTHGTDLLQQYELARSGCELPDWRDQSALLDIVQKRLDTEESVEAVLSHFAPEADAQKFVARSVLRRTVDARIDAAVSRVLFGGKVDWATVDRELSDTPKPADKLDKLRKAMLIAPGDPAGDTRLVRLLADAGQVSEALSHGRRLRDRGFMTPILAQCLGDVLAQAGERDEALRTYSEIVEFDPANPASRRALGDAFLRHGWYAAAYRQYRTLADLEPKNPLNWLRLASSAAGSGRIDEALRIEREVATDEGSPGPNDPRVWARLWSGARLGLLLDDPTPAGGKPALDSIVRKLKELQLFSGPGTLALLTWEDLDASLVLSGKEAGKESLAGEETDAAATGMSALLLNKDAWDRLRWSVRWRNDARGRPAKYAVVELNWDGKSFAVRVHRGEVKPDQQDTPL